MSEIMAYVGKAPCGCGRLFIVDDPAHKRDTAKEIGKAIRQGLTVTHMPLEDARPLIQRCPHEQKETRA